MKKADRNKIKIKKKLKENSRPLKFFLPPLSWAMVFRKVHSAAVSVVSLI